MLNNATIKEIVLHIGMHKTGTSSIQRSLRNFDDGDIRYARFGYQNHSVAAITVFEENPYDYYMHNGSGYNQKKIEELRSEYRSQLYHELSLTRRKLIFSGEDISLLTPEAVLSLKRILSPHCEKITVIAYIREPFGFIESTFQERIKNRGTNFQIETPNYRNRFEKFIEVFGSNNVNFFEYSKDSISDGSVVSDFCKKVGISSMGRIEEKAVNVSLSWAATQFLFLFNREGVQSYGSSSALKARNKLINELQRLPSEKFKISDELIHNSLDEDDINWMKQVSKLGLNPPGNRESDPRNSIASEKDLIAISNSSIQELRTLVKKKTRVKDDDAAIDMLNKLYIYFCRRQITKMQKINNLTRALINRITMF